MCLGDGAAGGNNNGFGRMGWGSPPKWLSDGAMGMFNRPWKNSTGAAPPTPMGAPDPMGGGRIDSPREPATMGGTQPAVPRLNPDQNNYFTDPGRLGTGYHPPPGSPPIEMQSLAGDGYGVTPPPVPRLYDPNIPPPKPMIPVAPGNPTPPKPMIPIPQPQQMI